MDERVLKTAVVYLTSTPKKTDGNLLRIKSQLENMDDVDLYIAGYDRRSEKSNQDYKGIEQYIFNQQNALDLNMLGKHRFDKEGNLVFIPGNCDYNYLLFFKEKPDYDDYYFIEDDVFYTGDLKELITTLAEDRSELLCTHVTPYNPEWVYNKLFTSGDYVDKKPTRTCFLPFFRITKSGLEKVTKGFSKGVGGHSEMTWPFILDNENCTIRDIGGEGPFVSERYRSKFYKGYTEHGMQNGTFIANPASFFTGREKNCLYHPIKPPMDAMKTKIRRVKSIFNYYLLVIMNKKHA